MRRAVLTATVAAAATTFGAVGLAADPAAATSTVCQQDGVANLCASSLDEDSVVINYQVTQLDGPGTYSVFYTSNTTGVSSNPKTIGPVAYQRTVSGTLYAALNDCYTVYLTSTDGTSLSTGPVCG